MFSFRFAWFFLQFIWVVSQKKSIELFFTNPCLSNIISTWVIQVIIIQQNKSIIFKYQKIE